MAGLRPEVKRRLRELAASFESHRKQNHTAHQVRPQIKPGTRLIRQWQGEIHSVTVCETGFEHDGKRYESLSRDCPSDHRHALVRATLFFGLKQSRKTAEQAR